MQNPIETLLESSSELLWEISAVDNSFHVSCLNQRLQIGGSGFSNSRATAKKIAFAELNERYLVQQLGGMSPHRQEWRLDKDSSASGFAAGYCESKTILRAIFEAVERWALSKWVDDGLALNDITEEVSISSLKSHSFFERRTVHHVSVPVLFNRTVLAIQVAVVLGWTDRGVFAGYGTRLNIDEAIQHAEIEAARNFVIHKNQQKRSKFPYNRIEFFAANRSLAESIIATRSKSPWPNPHLTFLKSKQFGELFLARAMFAGWVPWQIGTADRFLY